VGELSSTTRPYAEVLFRGTNLPIIITDRNRVIACALHDLGAGGVKIASEQEYSDAIDRAGKVARMKVLCGKTGQTVDADVVLNK
jgi:hypothetical protein